MKYRVLDTDGTELDVVDDQDTCGPFDGKCGGCGSCLLQQAWYAGFETEPVLPVITDTETGCPPVQKR